MRRHPASGWRVATLLLLLGPAADLEGAGAAEPAGPGRYALEFDGESSFVWLNQAVPDGLAQGTVELWFRLDRPWDDGPTMPLIGDDAGRLNLVLRDGRLAFNKNLDYNAQEVALEPARLAPGWHHAAGTWGPGGMKLFVDGKRVGSRPDGLPFQRYKAPYGVVPCESRLGMVSGWSADRRVSHFAGQIAFARVSEEPLYDGDFAPRIEAPAASKADVFRYDFAEGRGAALADSGGRGHDALIAGATWRELEGTPWLAEGPPPAAPAPAADGPAILLPFGCRAEMMADPSELQGFHLTAAAVLDAFGGPAVAAEDRALAVAPAADFPHRDRLDDQALARALAIGGASAVAYGYIEPAGGEGRDPEDRTAPARLTLRVLRPGQAPWGAEIAMASQSAGDYGEAQRAAARALWEQLAPAGRRVEMKGLPAGGAPEPARELLRRAADRSRSQDTFALVEAALAAADAVRAEPRRTEGWRLLAQAYAWIGGSPSRGYSGLGRSAIARARAAQNVATMLDGPTPENRLTEALIARGIPDYRAARAIALELDGVKHPWSPEQAAILAFAAGEEARIPAAAEAQGTFGPLIRGRIRLINAKRPPALESFEAAWALDRRISAAPGLIAEAAGTSGVGTLRRIAPEALGPGLVGAGRLAARGVLIATGHAGPARDFVRRAAEAVGRPVPELAGDEADPQAVDRAVLAALGADHGDFGPDQDQALRLMDALRDLEQDLAAAIRRAPRGPGHPGLALSPDPDLVRRLARVESQAGFDVLLQLLVRSLVVPAEAMEVLTRLVGACGYDAMAAHWATLFLTSNRSAKGKLPWPPPLPWLAPAFDRGYEEVIYLEPTYTADLRRDTRRRFPYWDVPWREEQRPEAYARNPYSDQDLRLWLRAAQGAERRRRLDAALADTPESAAARRVAAEVLLRDFAVRDEPRGLALLEGLIAEDPGATATYRALAEYHLDAGRPDDAMRWLGQLAGRPMESLDPVFARLRMADIDKARGDQDRLEVHLSEAARSFQGDAVLRYARLLADCKRLDQAVQLFEAVRQRYPPGAFAVMWESVALDQAGQRDRARALLRGYVSRVPYGSAVAPALGYANVSKDYAFVRELGAGLAAGRAGNLLLTEANLETGHPEAALAAARAAKEVGMTSNADAEDDAVKAALMLARAVGAQAVALRSRGRDAEARELLEGFARQVGLAQLAAVLAPYVVATWPAASAGAGQPAPAEADRGRWLAESLEVLAAAGKPDDPGVEVARRLAACPGVDGVLREYIDRGERQLLSPNNQLRVAARQVIRRGLVPPDAGRALAAALVRLDPKWTWVSQQAAVFAEAYGPGGRAEFLGVVGGLGLGGDDLADYQRAADSWGDWWVLGPFPDDRLDGINRPFLDESRPVDTAAPALSGGRELRWRRPLPGRTWGGLSLTAELEAPREPDVFYAYREIVVEGQAGVAQPIRLRGPQSARVFLDGRERALWLESDDYSKDLDLDLPLVPGVNRVLLKLRYAAGKSQNIWCQFPPRGPEGHP